MREAILAIVLLAAGLAGCVGTDDATTETTPAAERADERVPPSAWRGNLTEPVYDSIESAVHEATARDGTRLSLTVHLPAGLDDGERVPTLLQITPYQSFVVPHTSTPATGTDEPAQSWAKYVERGAAYVEADARGTGASEGCLDFGGSKDRADAEAFVQWIRERDWSNGVVVTDGVSHPGMGSLVAHAAVPGLDGALAHAPVVSYYQDEWYQGAKFEDQANGPAYTAVESSPPLYADPDAAAAQADDCHHETTAEFGQIEGPFTDTWADRDLSRHVEDASDTPLLLTQGFVDVNVHPDHAREYWDALPEDAPAWLVMGWWYHGWPDVDGHAFDSFEDVRHRWLDHLLFERDNGATDEPRVLVEDDAGTWHEGRDWPLDGSRTVTLNATSEGSLADRPADAGGLSYPDDPDARRGAWGQAKVLLESEPLDTDRLVNGAPTVHLTASSSEDATKWVVYLVELTDDGEVQRISHGYADSHTHGEEGTWQPIEPGQAHDWTVELMPTAVRVEAGHAIGLLVASSDSRNADEAHQLALGEGEAGCWDDHRGGCYEPSGIVPADTQGRAENTVHTGPDATSVQLSWVDPDATAKPPWN